MSLRSAYSTIFTPVLTPDQPFQGRIDAAIPGNLSVGDSTTNYAMSLNGQTISSSNGILSVSGGLSITGNLNASGGTFRGPVNISGITTVSALNVQNYLNVSGLTTVSGLTVQRNLNVSGSAAISSNLTVTQSVSTALTYTTNISGLARINGAPYIPGGNPYNWSDYPAISDVSFGAHNLSNINNVNVSGGAVIDGVLEVKTQVSAGSVYATNISGVALINGAPYVPGVDPANWATYPAVTNLDMSGSNIGSVNALNISGRSVFDGSLNVNNIATVTSNFNVSGLANLSGATIHNRLTVSGLLTASGATIQSNIVVAGSVLTNAATVSNNLGVSGAAVICNATVQNVLNVSGLTTLTSANVVSSFNVSGMATMSGATVQNTLSASNVNTTTITGVTSINGTPYNASGYPTLWADYPAATNVDLSGNNLFNVNTLNASGFSVLAGGVSVPAQATLSDLVVSNTKIHIGADAGNITQASNTIAIGVSAGYSNQGLNAIAIGNKAGLSNQSSNSIILNASSNALNAAAPGFFVTPVGQSSNLSGLQIMTYDPATSQIQQNSNVTISGGRLGIGLVNPSTLLHISNATDATLRLQSTYTNSTSHAKETLTKVLFANSDGSTTFGAGIQMSVPSNATINESDLEFTTCDNVGNQQIRMIVKGSGNSNGGRVGIGTNDPSGSLHVHTSSTSLPATTYLTNNYAGSNTTGSDVNTASFAIGTSPYFCSIRTNVPATGFGDSERLDFCTPLIANNNSQTTRMSIMPFTGYVGINTVTPQTTLDVYGKVNIDSNTANPPQNGNYGGSSGARLVLYPGSPSDTPYALGIGTNTMWYGTNSTGTHEWYAGTQRTMTLDSAGTLSAASVIYANGGFLQTTRTGTSTSNIQSYLTLKTVNTTSDEFQQVSHILSDICGAGLGFQTYQYITYIYPLEAKSPTRGTIIQADQLYLHDNSGQGYYAGDRKFNYNVFVGGSVFQTVPPMWCYSRQNIRNSIGYGSNTIPWTNADYEYNVALIPGSNTGTGASAYANSHWYAPFNGIYKISMCLHIDSGYIGIYKNDAFINPGEPWGRSTSLAAANSGLSTGNATILIVLTLATDDRISFQLYDDPDNQTTAIGGTFIVELIKRT